MVHTALTLAPRGKIAGDSLLLHFLLSKFFYAFCAQGQLLYTKEKGFFGAPN